MSALPFADIALFAAMQTPGLAGRERAQREEFIASPVLNRSLAVRPGRLSRRYGAYWSHTSWSDANATHEVELQIHRRHLQRRQPGNPSEGLFEPLMKSTLQGWQLPPARHAFVPADDSIITEIRKCDPPSAHTKLLTPLPATHWVMRQE